MFFHHIYKSKNSKSCIFAKIKWKVTFNLSDCPNNKIHVTADKNKVIFQGLRHTFLCGGGGGGAKKK